MSHEATSASSWLPRKFLSAEALAVWSSGMILASGAREVRFDAFLSIGGETRLASSKISMCKNHAAVKRAAARYGHTGD